MLHTSVNFGNLGVAVVRPAEAIPVKNSRNTFFCRLLIFSIEAIINKENVKFTANEMFSSNHKAVLLQRFEINKLCSRFFC